MPSNIGSRPRVVDENSTSRTCPPGAQPSDSQYVLASSAFAFTAVSATLLSGIEISCRLFLHRCLLCTHMQILPKAISTGEPHRVNFRVLGRQPARCRGCPCPTDFARP